MPVVYHGTSVPFATAMATTPGTIDVTRGGGEFGRGFYTQPSYANALTWAINRFPNQACTLKLEVDDEHMATLAIRYLNRKQAKKLTARIRNAGTQMTHLVGRDVVVGPLNLSRRKTQEKWETDTAEALLNGPNTTRTVV